MQMTQEEFDRERQIQSEIWGVRKRYYNIDDTDDAWDSLLDEIEKVSIKYCSLYVDQMLLVCLDDIETRCMNRRGDAGIPDADKLKRTLFFHDNLKMRERYAKTTRA